jgi:lysine 6-dehydrogenase
MTGIHMQVSVLGTGLMGSTVVLDLLNNPYVSKVIACDADPTRLRKLRSKVSSNNKKTAKLRCKRINVTNRTQLFGVLKKCQLAIGALPHSLSQLAVKAALEADVDFIDLIFSWRYTELAQLNKLAEKRDVLIIPACGLAPGLTNILAARISQKIINVNEIKISVGGLPQQPKPPLNYRIVFSLESVLEEYTRSALIVKDEKITEVPALSGLEDISFSKVNGEFEQFYTDGLSTLPYTLKNVKNMGEKTIRWKGHCMQIKTLAECGLLDKSPSLMLQNGIKISPIKILAEVLSKRLRLKEEEKDFTLLRVLGLNEGGKIAKQFEMVDYFDEKRAMTSMARTTAFTCTTVAEMVIEGEVRGAGLLPPEKVVTLNGNFEIFEERLRSKGVVVEEVTPQ